MVGKNPLRIRINNGLIFEPQVSTICKRLSQKLLALNSVTKYMQTC